MNKPKLKKDSFSVDDIHKIREYNYERTKNLSSKDLIKGLLQVNTKKRLTFL